MEKKTNVLFLALITNLNYSALGLERMTAYLQADASLDVVLKYYDMSKEIEEGDIADFSSFEFIGMSVYHNSVDYAYSIAARIKRASPKTVIFIGSTFATITADELLRESSDIDFIVLGNGEIPVKEAINILKNDPNLSKLKDHENIKIKGFPNENKKPYNASIKELPWPWKGNPYETNLVYISTREGCIGTCSFCSVHINGYKHGSEREPQEVVNEICAIYDQTKVDHFFFTDGSFEGTGRKGKERIGEFCKLVQGLPKKFSFICYMQPTSIREDDLSLLRNMAEAGFANIFLGVESANESDLLLYGKRNTLIDSQRSLTLLKKAGISPLIGFIMLNPYSTRERMSENYRFLVENEIHFLYPYFSRLMVFYNTPIYKHLRQDNLLHSEYNFRTPYNYLICDDHAKKIFRKVIELDEGKGLGEMEMTFGNINNYINSFKAKYHEHQIYLEVKDALENYYKEITMLNRDFWYHVYVDFNENLIDQNFEHYKSTILLIVGKINKIKNRFIKYEVIQHGEFEKIRKIVLV